MHNWYKEISGAKRLLVLSNYWCKQIVGTRTWGGAALCSLFYLVPPVQHYLQPANRRPNTSRRSDCLVVLANRRDHGSGLVILIIYKLFLINSNNNKVLYI